MFLAIAVDNLADADALNESDAKDDDDAADIDAVVYEVCTHSCHVDHMGKPSATGQPTGPTQPFEVDK